MFLPFKLLRIRWQTKVSTKNQDCPEATANLAVVETAKPVSEVVSYKTKAQEHQRYVDFR